MKKIIVLNILFIIFYFIGCKPETRTQVTFNVDASKTIGENTYFWKSAQPIPFAASQKDAGLALIDRAGRYNSIEYLRSHNTFDENGGDVVKYKPDGSYYFDFSYVNKTFQEYVRHGIKPVVEFDFFPKGWAKLLGAEKNDEGFDARKGEPRDWNQWEVLMRAFMQNLVDTFGKEEMRTWYYEVWNEPDGWPVKHLPVFFRLYDTFAHVVKSFDKDFKVGGPACFNLFFMEYFLQHVVNGTNFVTGEKGSPIDFISYHVYGLSGAWLHSPPEIVPQVSRFTVELLWVERMLLRHGLKGKVEFHLNEWGVCSNYERTVAEYPQLVYRNNEFSPLFLVKMVDCLYALEEYFDFKTSMMTYCGFSLEAEHNVMFRGNRDLTTGGNIPKPILTGFEMLAKLGKERLAIEDGFIGSRFARGERFGIIPTKEDDRIVFIIYNFNETDDNLDHFDDIIIKLNNLPAGKKYKWEEILLDDKHNNNYALWLENGKPSDPSSLTSDFIKEATKIRVTGKGTVKADGSGIVTMKIPLKRHSMKLYVLN